MINITYDQAATILAAFGEDKEGVASLSKGDGHEGNGLYLGWSGYPDEGSIFLGKEE